MSLYYLPAFIGPKNTRQVKSNESVFKTWFEYRRNNVFKARVEIREPNVLNSFRAMMALCVFRNSMFSKGQRTIKDVTYAIYISDL